MKKISTQDIEEVYRFEIAKLHKVRMMAATYNYLPQDEISEKHDQLSDAILYIVLLKLDMAIACKHLLVNRSKGDGFEMKYFARALAIHCSDIAKTNNGRILSQVKAIAELYKSEQKYREHCLRLFNRRRTIIRIGEENTDFIDGIRNNLFAHRDGAAIKQNQDIDNIDMDRLASVATDIGDVLHTMMIDLLEIQQILAPINVDPKNHQTNSEPQV